MGIIDVLAVIGGVTQILAWISVFLVSPYSEMSFFISAINEMYSIRSNDKSVHINCSHKMHIGFCSKVKLILNCCPNKKMKRLIEKGQEKFERELDLLSLFKQHKHHARHLKELHLDEKDDSLDVDNSSDS